MATTLDVRQSVIDGATALQNLATAIQNRNQGLLRTAAGALKTVTVDCGSIPAEHPLAGKLLAMRMLSRTFGDPNTLTLTDRNIVNKVPANLTAQAQSYFAEADSTMDLDS